MADNEKMKKYLSDEWCGKIRELLYAYAVRYSKGKAKINKWFEKFLILYPTFQEWTDNCDMPRDIRIETGEILGRVAVLEDKSAKIMSDDFRERITSPYVMCEWNSEIEKIIDKGIKNI